MDKRNRLLSHRHSSPGIKFLHFRLCSCGPGTGRTVSYVAAPPTGAEPVVTAGVASLAARDLLRGISRRGKVLAALPHAIYLDFTDAVPEPRVITVSPPRSEERRVGKECA